MLLQRRQVTDGTATATAKALDYSLKRWAALTQFLDNAQLPIDNNWIENQIRPIAIGRIWFSIQLLLVATMQPAVLCELASDVGRFLPR